MSTKIQVRRGSYSDWNTNNPVLSIGEWGYITTGTNAGMYKIGDGSTAWNTLEYATDASNFVGVLSAAKGGTGNAYVDRTVIAQASASAAINGSAVADVMTSAFQASGANRYITLQASSSYYVEVFIPFTKAASATGSSFRISFICKDASTGADIDPSALFFAWTTITNSAASSSGTIYATGVNSPFSVTTSSTGTQTQWLRAVGYIFTSATAPKITIGFGQSVAPSSGVPQVSNTYTAVYKLTTSSTTMNGAWQS